MEMGKRDPELMWMRALFRQTQHDEYLNTGPDSLDMESSLHGLLCLSVSVHRVLEETSYFCWKINVNPVRNKDHVFYKERTNNSTVKGREMLVRQWPHHPFPPDCTQWIIYTLHKGLSSQHRNTESFLNLKLADIFHSEQSWIVRNSVGGGGLLPGEALCLLGIENGKR